MISSSSPRLCVRGHCPQPLDRTTDGWIVIVYCFNLGGIFHISLSIGNGASWNMIFSQGFDVGKFLVILLLFFQCGQRLDYQMMFFEQLLTIYFVSFRQKLSWISVGILIILTLNLKCFFLVTIFGLTVPFTSLIYSFHNFSTKCISEQSIGLKT